MCSVCFSRPPAPAQPPLNIEWTLIGPLLSLYWDPVVAMELESEVTGYQVDLRVQLLTKTLWTVKVFKCFPPNPSL